MIPNPDGSSYGPDLDPISLDLGGPSAESGRDAFFDTPAAIGASATGSHAQYDTQPLHAPRPRRAATVSRSDAGMVNLNPTGLAGVDYGAELSAALTLRMKPPPEPAADLNLSTGGWLALTAAAATAWIVGVVYEPAFLPFVALVGGLMIAVGYFWAAYLAGRSNWLRGLVTLLPPVAVWRLFLPFGDNGYQPLRYVLTGLLAVALWAAGPLAHSATQSALAAMEFSRPELVRNPPPTLAERLSAAMNLPDGGAGVVHDLASPEYRDETPVEERPALVKELRQLVRAGRAEVRPQALRTLCLWSESEGREAVLAALRTGTAAERRTALELARNWSDDDMAAAVAARLGNRSEEDLVRETLLSMNPTVAEFALVKSLPTASPMAVPATLALLEQFGGQGCVAALDELARSAPDFSTRSEAARTAAAIRARLDEPAER